MEAETTVDVPEPQPSLEDMATHSIIVLLPKFQTKIETMSLRAVKNVLLKLIEYPLMEKFTKFEDTDQNELFNLGIQIQDAKFVIVKAVLDMKKEEINKIFEEKTDESV